jgi:pyoverdine/dityrosine biosynthesis protein Dit1
MQEDHQTAGDDFAIAEQILAILLPYRRTESVHRHTADNLTDCFSHQLQQIQRFIAAGLPITFTLPAFPCKSPNPNKVLGHLPDMGERASLRFLHSLCMQVEEVYEPGARMLVCSDGHVFADLIKVPDEHVEEYGAALEKMIAEEATSSIELFSLADVYGDLSYPEKRRILTDEFAQSIDSLRAEVRVNDDTLRLYRGITRFLVEDTKDPESMGSKRALQRDSKQRAYGVIQRSRAWSDLVDEHHKDSVRLSIHPQPCGVPKLGIALLNIENPWVTPWHSVAVLDQDGEIFLTKRSEAAQIGRLVLVDGKPSHYEWDAPATDVPRSAA